MRAHQLLVFVATAFMLKVLLLTLKCLILRWGPIAQQVRRLKSSVAAALVCCAFDLPHGWNLADLLSAWCSRSDFFLLDNVLLSWAATASADGI